MDSLIDQVAADIINTPELLQLALTDREELSRRLPKLLNQRNERNCAIFDRYCTDREFRDTITENLSVATYKAIRNQPDQAGQ